MKTQIIHLESHDDNISVRDKMGWTKTARILLVWPERERLLTRQIDLVLLQRHSQSLGAQLAMVTQDNIVKFHAQRLLIPVYQNIKQAHNSIWRTHRRGRLSLIKSFQSPLARRIDLAGLKAIAHPQPAKWVQNPILNLVAFMVSVMAALTIVAVLLPRAEVRLSPEYSSQDIALWVRASSEFEGLKLSGEIPAKKVSVVVENSQSLITTDSISIPLEAAKGNILVTNLTNKSISIPIGLVVRSQGEPPVRFYTTQSGEIPGEIGKAISIQVQALQPGTIGNLPSGSLLAVEGDMGLDVSISNPQPTTGGTNHLSSAPSSEDYQNLFYDVLSTLQIDSLANIKNQLAPGDILLSEIPIYSSTLSRIFKPEEPQPVDELQLTMIQDCQYLVVSNEDLVNLVQIILDARLQEGYQVVPDSIQISNLTQPVEINQIYEWQIKVTRSLYARITQNQVINHIIAMKPSSAVKRLSETLPLQGNPQITLSPSWWPRLPILPFRIRIIMD